MRLVRTIYIPNKVEKFVWLKSDIIRQIDPSYKVSYTIHLDEHINQVYVFYFSTHFNILL